MWSPNIYGLTNMGFMPPTLQPFLDDGCEFQRIGLMGLMPSL